MVLIPESYEASCYWGGNAQWCTSTRTSRNWFDTYDKAGALFIIINKNDPKEKYQYYSTDRDFNDIENESRSLQIFIKEQTNPDFKNFLENDMIDIGNDISSEKYSSLMVEDFYKTFDEEIEYELRDFAVENGKIPDDVREAAMELIRDGNLDQFEMQSSREYHTYIDWDVIKENLDYELNKIKNRIYEKELEEEGQGKLPFEEIENEL